MITERVKEMTEIHTVRMLVTICLEVHLFHNLDDLGIYRPRKSQYRKRT
jgi:hypothetical protein